MLYYRTLLAGTLILVHLVTLLFVPYVHVHPEEDHGHIRGNIGHVHVLAVLENAGRCGDVSFDEPFHDTLHPEVPGHLLLSGTSWFYTTVSHFRWHTPIHFIVSVLFPQFYRLSPVIPAIFNFPGIDVFSSLLLSHTIFLAADLPPPVA